jgi:hypothetical protein
LKGQYYLLLPLKAVRFVGENENFVETSGRKPGGKALIDRFLDEGARERK